MSNELKRVGLIFTEEGSADFRKSLQLVNSEISKNYSEFKKTQALWDNSTKTTEKLRYRIENLNNAYELQQDKITILKSQLSELENAENKDITAISKKRTEIEKAELKLISYSKKIKELSEQLLNSGKNIQEVGEKIEKMGSKIESSGKKVSAFSLAIGSAMVASAKTAIDFEDAFVGVEKTVDGTAEEMENLKQGIRDMAKEIPSSTTEISQVAEAAGQLGIKTEDILKFTRVMIDLGNSTNLSAEEAASSLAKFANVTKMSAKDYDKLGSTIVALGNNFATTEKDIVEMATRLAATGELTGLTQSQIMGLATAMSSVGIEAEAGGSAMSKLLKKIQLATELGGEDLEDFAKIAGMTSDEFKRAFEKDAVKALSTFISGLNDTERNGKSAIAILDDMGLTEVRLSNTILSLANASDVMNGAVELANSAWEDNTALTQEANKRYGDLKSKIEIALNKLKDMAITLGNKLMPSIEKIIDKVGEWIKKIESLSNEELDMIVKIGMVVTAIGPLLTIIGKLTSTIGGITKGIGTVVEAFGVMQGKITSTSTTVNGLANVFSAITSPIGIACTAVGLAIAGIAIAVNKSQEEIKKDFETMGNSATNFVSGIENATSYLNSFNSEIFASSQEQQELATQMDEIQAGITSICKTASDERRGYTQEEIEQLDKYFEQLRELSQREIKIQNEVAGAMTQQAVANAETFQGTLEEYKQQSQEWIKTAQEQKDKTLELIKNQTIEEIALLNQKYGDQANMQNESYANEYNKIIEEQQKKVDAANNEVAKVSEAYTNGYADRLLKNEEFKAKLEEYNKLVEEENQRHSGKIEEINNNTGESEYILFKKREKENDDHFWKMKSIQDDLYKDMSDSETEQLGVLIGMASNTELYGGKMEDETKTTVDTIVNSYEEMPSKTRTAMKNAMSPMLDEMQNAEPGLFSKAKGIADGIISRLKKAFDEHSPSRKTRKIMKFAMQPMEEEMEEGKKSLFKEANEIGNGITDRLNNIDGNVEYGLHGENSNYNYTDNGSIDYNKMASAFLSALNNCKLKLDEDGFARIVKDEIFKVV